VASDSPDRPVSLAATEIQDRTAALVKTVRPVPMLRQVSPRINRIGALTALRHPLVPLDFPVDRAAADSPALRDLMARTAIRERRAPPVLLDHPDKMDIRDRKVNRVLRDRSSINRAVPVRPVLPAFLDRKALMDFQERTATTVVPDFPVLQVIMVILVLLAETDRLACRAATAALAREAVAIIVRHRELPPDIDKLTQTSIYSMIDRHLYRMTLLEFIVST